MKIGIKKPSNFENSLKALGSGLWIVLLSLGAVSPGLCAAEGASSENSVAESKQSAGEKKVASNPAFIWHAMIGLAAYHYLELGYAYQVDYLKKGEANRPRSVSAKPAQDLVSSIYFFSVALAKDATMKQAWTNYRQKYPSPMDIITDPNWMTRPTQVRMTKEAIEKGTQLLALLDKSAQSETADQVQKLFEDVTTLTYSPLVLANRDYRYIPAAIYVGVINEWLALRPSDDPLAQAIGDHMNKKFPGHKEQYDDILRLWGAQSSLNN